MAMADDESKENNRITGPPLTSIEKRDDNPSVAAPGSSCVESSNDTVLETIDDCVVCAEGADDQHHYEERLLEDHLTSKQHGLSDQEAAVIRLQMMEQNSYSSKSATTTSITLPAMDELNLCGVDSSEEDAVALVLFSDNKDHCILCIQAPQAFATMPCCKAQNMCTACLLLLSHPCASGGRVGHCPQCRNWFAATVQEEGLVNIDSVTPMEGLCDICHQDKLFLLEPSLCDACFLGKQRALIYECKECHGHQRIPHPMYRYQSSMETFGRSSWACQMECQKFTTWRILENQAKYIPVGDEPREWNTNLLDLARQRVQQARRLVKNKENASADRDLRCAIQ
jgi:hypothetical protein